MKAIRFSLLFVLLALFLTKCEFFKKEKITIGGTFPLTGEVASYGVNAKNGILLKIEEVNNAGGINGKLLEIDFQDDMNSIKDAVSNFNNFATIKNYPVVFGSAGSSVTLSLVPLANRYKMVLISPVSSSSMLSSEGGPFFFRTVPSDNLQAETLANWVYEDGNRKVALVYTNNSWGKPLADGFKEIFQQKGGQIFFEENVQEGTTDFRTIILKLKANDYDAIVSPTYPKEGGAFVRQLKENNLDIQLYGGDNWGSPEFLAIARGAAEGVMFTFPSESESPIYDDFKNNFKQRFGYEPDIISAYGYDAAFAIVESLKKVKKVSSESIRDSLHTVAFQGVSEYISFKENGDVKSEGYGKRTIQNGKIISLN